MNLNASLDLPLPKERNIKEHLKALVVIARYFEMLIIKKYKADKCLLNKPHRIGREGIVNIASPSDPHNNVVLSTHSVLRGILLSGIKLVMSILCFVVLLASQGLVFIWDLS